MLNTLNTMYVIQYTQNAWEMQSSSNVTEYCNFKLSLRSKSNCDTIITNGHGCVCFFLFSMNINNICNKQQQGK